MTSENRISVLKKVLAYEDENAAGHINEVELSDWEDNFLTSMRSAFNRFGESGTRVSDKQFAALERILKKFEDAQ